MSSINLNKHKVQFTVTLTYNHSNKPDNSGSQCLHKSYNEVGQKSRYFSQACHKGSSMLNMNVLPSIPTTALSK